ncbi:MAG: hypothetical protein IKR48_01345 [Kiritimatiellae bacterium]|nr:hypothetical protein [Kiritimatiellia bacterium]
MTRSERKELRKRMTWLHRPRPPFGYWGQFVVLFGCLFWFSWLAWQVLQTSRTPATTPRAFSAAYVTLTPEDAHKAFRETRFFLSPTDGTTNDFAVDWVDLGMRLPPHRNWEDNVAYPGAWSPDPVRPLPERTSEILTPSPTSFQGRQELPPPPQGVFTTLSTGLRSAAFRFPYPDDELLKVASGSASFSIEVDTNGAVASVFLLSPRTPAAAVWESFLGRGEAIRPCRGELTIVWRR